MRDLIIASIIVDALKKLKMKVPQKLPESLKDNANVAALLRAALKLRRKDRNGKEGMELRDAIIGFLK